MRSPVYLLWAVVLMAAPVAWAVAEEPPAPPPRENTPAPPPADNPEPTLIGSHQIDRYDAINRLQQDLKNNPKSEADWVILGELAQEVADDLPSDQAVKFYQMSRDAYEKALELDPNNPGLKAAVAFARDRESNASKFSKARNQSTQTYLEARRRDLAATRYTPAIRTYTPRGLPYTYNQFTSGYSPPNIDTPGVQPMTVQRSLQQVPVPGPMLNPVERQLIQGTRPTVPPAPVPPGMLPPEQSRMGRPQDINASPLSNVPTPGVPGTGVPGPGGGPPPGVTAPTVPEAVPPPGAPSTGPSGEAAVPGGPPGPATP